MCPGGILQFHQNDPAQHLHGLAPGFEMQCFHKIDNIDPIIFRIFPADISHNRSSACLLTHMLVTVFLGQHPRLHKFYVWQHLSKFSFPLTETPPKPSRTPCFSFVTFQLPFLAPFPTLPGDFLPTPQDIEQFLRTEVAHRYGEADGPQKPIACISDKDVETAVAFMAVEFPMEHLRAFVLQILGEMGRRRNWGWYILYNLV